MEIVDDILTPQAVLEIYAACCQAPFRCVESDRGDTDTRDASWVSEPVEPAILSAIAKGLKALPRIADSLAGLSLARGYINAIKFGDRPRRHRDSLSSNDMTVLYYANPAWDVDWGGETVFYEETEIMRAVIPRPGRVVVFSASLEHSARPPTSLLEHYRYTIAMKFVRPDRVDDYLAALGRGQKGST